MPNYKRHKIPGGTYFFTVVAFNRQNILCGAESRAILKSSIIEVRKTLPFVIDAWVLLPDHLHCIWTLPKNDDDFSKRWGMIKKNFTQQIKNVEYASFDEKIYASRQKHRESNIWQRRFWEHYIRDQDDFNKHCDYIHLNPVKHGLVTDPRKWGYSTIHRFIERGIYPENWGSSTNAE